MTPSRQISAAVAAAMIVMGGIACVTAEETSTASAPPADSSAVTTAEPSVAAAASQVMQRHPAAIPDKSHASLAHVRALMADANKPMFTIVALGDSNTELNWTSQGHLNWVGLLSAGLFESGYHGRYKVINAGLSGDSAMNALKRLDRDVLVHKPDLVIITFGGNDERLNTPQETEQSMRELIRRVRAAGESSILVRTPVPFFDDKGGYEENANYSAHVEAVRRAAVAEDVAMLDVFALWTAPEQTLPPSTYRYDRLHPNAHGHRRMYAELAPLFGLHETLRWEK